MLKPARAERTTLTEVAERELRQAIVHGTYKPGTQLPTEAELVEMLGVSRTVVREALRTLEEDGLIMRRHGVGTFVRNRPILKNLNLNFGITEMVQSAGLKAGTSYLDVQHETATQEMAEQLKLAEGAPVVTVSRVRTADGRPVVFTQDTLDETRLRQINFDFDRLRTESIYDIMQIEFGKPIDYGIARILPGNAPEQVAKQLDLPPDSGVLYIVQTDYSPDDEPLLYSREYHLPDAFDFIIWRRGPAKLRSS
jgi:DNA-binding GntR family transcriptional regulator